MNNYVAQEPCAGFRFLVADDEALNRKLMKAVLELASIEPVLVCNGLEALQLLSAERFDAAILDINMPVMDGVEAVRQYRLLEETSGSRRIPIIACTAITQPKKVVEFMSVGFDRFLAKPVNMIEVSECLSWIGQQDRPGPK